MRAHAHVHYYYRFHFRLSLVPSSTPLIPVACVVPPHRRMNGIERNLQSRPPTHTHTHRLAHTGVYSEFCRVPTMDFIFSRTLFVSHAHFSTHLLLRSNGSYLMLRLCAGRYSTRHATYTCELRVKL